MSSFRVVAIPTEIASEVRATGKSPKYGFPVHREVAAGRAPCRHCLRLIAKNEEELLLFTYDPFQETGATPLPGPVYLHAESCARFAGNGSIPEEYRGVPLTLEAFGADRKRIGEIRVEGGGEQEAAERLFADPAVGYVHVRSTTAGCYLFRLERSMGWMDFCV